MELKHIEMIKNTARDCMLFREMNGEELSALLTCLDFRVRSFGRNDVINMAGTHSRASAWWSTGRWPWSRRM